ncbi:methylenetetrahydrofolate reductase [Ammonifex degensii KC4]|uniref:Methylenetetrahydrofolate reductase n=1 Tax=Ammonifex degensii (strain DSM 10501 / KC4) TaxID=429009 RepID=C9RB79_AMMDK|nr:methylenetetrahydrofolate reductase [Ammonifex degensii KC4]
MRSGSRLERLLARGEFVVTAEIGPPKHASAEPLIRKARMLKGYVDAANITDCQTAVVRMASIPAAVHLLREGIEPVIQMTCRDRNRIAIQADLLGAYSLGIRNLLCLTGDHPAVGDHPEAKGVFDLDAIQLLDMVRRLRDEKVFQSGVPLKGPEPRFFLGAAENPCGDPVELRVMRLAKKVEAGADFIQTQCVFDLECFSRWMELVRKDGLDRRVYILAGVTPLKSARMANYMHENVPGISIPEEIRERMAKAADPHEEGIAIAVETIQALKKIPGVAGVHIMAIAWEEVVPEIVKRAGLFPRPQLPEDSDK